MLTLGHFEFEARHRRAWRNLYEAESRLRSGRLDDGQFDDEMRKSREAVEELERLNRASAARRAAKEGR